MTKTTMVQSNRKGTHTENVKPPGNMVIGTSTDQGRKGKGY